MNSVLGAFSASNFLAHFKPALFYGKDWIFELLRYLPSLIYPSSLLPAEVKCSIHISNCSFITRILSPWMEMGVWLHFLPFPGVVSSEICTPRNKKAALPTTHRLFSQDLCIHMGMKNVQMDSVQATGNTGNSTSSLLLSPLQKRRPFVLFRDTVS